MAVEGNGSTKILSVLFQDTYNESVVESLKKFDSFFLRYPQKKSKKLT